MKRRHLMLVVCLLAALATTGWLIASPQSSQWSAMASGAGLVNDQAPAVFWQRIRQPAPHAHRKAEEASCARQKPPTVIAT